VALVLASTASVDHMLPALFAWVGGVVLLGEGDACIVDHACQHIGRVDLLGPNHEKAPSVSLRAFGFGCCDLTGGNQAARSLCQA
jgi:hypothetical protein